MDRLYLLSWFYQGKSGESDARDFFEKLHKGLNEGIKFPFNCSSEVGLVHCAVDEHWCVGVLTMPGTKTSDSIEQTNLLHKWFKECNADFSGTERTGERVTLPSVEGTLRNCYGNHYTCLETFNPVVFVKEEKKGRKSSQGKNVKNENVAIQSPKKGRLKKEDKCVYCGRQSIDKEMVTLYKDVYRYNQKTTQTMDIAVPYCLECEAHRNKVKKADEAYEQSQIILITTIILGPILFILFSDFFWIGAISGLSIIGLGIIVFLITSNKHKRVDRTGLKTVSPYDYSDVKKAIKNGWRIHVSKT